MDYEQRYKEALDEAKVIHKTIRKDLKPVIEQIFPELKENEDEKIREAIICGMETLKAQNRTTFATISIDSCINWLKKQGEQKLVVPKFKVGDIVKDIEDGEVFIIRTVTEDKYIYTDDTFDWIKDQDTYVLVKPKFNLYDWVVTDKGDVVQIGAVNNGYYTLFNGMDFNMSYVDKCWHLWTNQDIKDGDILCTYECGKPKIIFILKGTPKKPYVLKYHCYYNVMYPYFESDSETGCLVVNDGDLKLATKEQRDTLFEKMKLEGYRWDEDKKEVIRYDSNR